MTVLPPVSSKSPRARALFLLAMSMGLVARLVMIASMGHRYYFADTREYRAVALDIFAGRMPGPDSPRGPVYPALMALGFRLGGMDSFVAVRLLQLVLAMTILALAWQLGRRVGGPAAGALTTLGLAVSPTLVFVTGLLYPTTLYTLLLLVLTAGAWALAQRPRWWLAAVLGGTVGLGLLTDEVMIAPAAATLAWLLAQSRRAGRGVVWCALIVAALGVGLDTLWVRLHQVGPQGRVEFLTKAQWSLWYERTDSTLASERWIRLAANQPFVALSPRAFVAREASLLAHRPAAYLHDYGGELLHFFSPAVDRLQTSNQFTRPVLLLLAAIHFWPILVFSILGALAGRARGADRGLLALTILSTAAFYAIFFAKTRYRIPVEPAFVLLAALGLLRVFPRFADWLNGVQAPGDRAAPGGSSTA